MDWGSQGIIYNLGTLYLINCAVINAAVVTTTKYDHIPNPSIRVDSCYFFGTGPYNSPSLYASTNNGFIQIYNTIFENGGYANVSGGNIYANLKKGVVLIDNCIFRYNKEGVMRSSGKMLIKNSLFANNSSTAFSTAVKLLSGKTTIINSTFTNNLTTDRGGAIYIEDGQLELIHCTIVNNKAGVLGGGIYNRDSLTIINSIIANNTADEYANDIINFKDPTFLPGSWYKYFKIQNSIVGDTTGSLILPMLGSNFMGDPGLGSLSDNGGFSYTHPLKVSSQAINAGLVIDSIKYDQRGVARDDAPDIGAFEYELPLVTSVDNSNSPNYLVYPNPVESYLVVSGEDIFEIEILDINGNRWMVSENTSYLDVGNLPSGFYYAKIKTNTGGSYFRKFVKR